MKNLLISTVLFTLILFDNGQLNAQSIAVFNLIGRQQKDVIAQYGQPAHIDNSSPSMICMFYKSPFMVFVADETSVYQAEITKEYTSEKELKEELTIMINKSVVDGFKADTLSMNSYVLDKPGVRAEIDFKNLAEVQKYQLKIKSKRHD